MLYNALWLFVWLWVNFDMEAKMTGIGTLINVLAIVCGGIIGIVFKKIINKRIQGTLTKAAGLCVLFIGIGGTLSKMLYIADGKIETRGTIMLIVSFVLGSFAGELINIERGFEKGGEWLKKKSKSQGDNEFVNAFITSSFTVCIGAMAIVGSIQEGINKDPTILITKALLDFIIIIMLASTLGKGCIFSAVPVALLQGTITLLSGFAAFAMTQNVILNISLVGSVLIFCVGVNLIYPKTFKVANMLPAVIVAAIVGFFA